MSEASASELVERRIAAIGDWRGEVLAQARRLIHEALPDVLESIKWRKPSNPDGVPVWERDGIICTGEAYRGKAKITFANGAKLEDPAGLFNGSLGGNTMRAIDVFEGDELDEDAFRDLVRAAADLNAAR